MSASINEKTETQIQERDHRCRDRMVKVGVELTFIDAFSANITTSDVGSSPW